MSNDSTRKPKRSPARARALPPDTPASVEAGALRDGEYLPKHPATDVAHARHSALKNGFSDEPQRGGSPEQPTDVALARHVSRVAIYREGDVEYMLVNGKRLYRDTYVAALLGLSRPRDIRKTIERVIKRGDIAPNQYMAITDDDITVYYVDSESSVLLAFNSNAGDKKSMVMRVLGCIRGVEETEKQIMSMKDALAGYDKTISYIARKDVPRAAKLAKIPLLECYARAAGQPVPDVSELLGPDQPRLDGV